MKSLRNAHQLRGAFTSLAQQSNAAVVKCVPEQEPTQLRKAALRIYVKALESVGPTTLVSRALEVDRGRSILKVHGKEYSLSENVYVIAFGQAVTGIIRSLEGYLGSHIVKSVAVLPHNTLQLLRESGKQNLMPHDACEIYEGAENNVPDERSHKATKRVLDVVESLTSKHLLVTVISGGCSALLSMPKPPVTIEDDAKLNWLLREAGASIRDKNIIRKNISMLKGGGLAKAAFPAKLLTLILSNLSQDDSYDLGGGPTTSDWSTPNQAIDMIRKYGLDDKVPHSIIDLLSKEAARNSERMQSQQWLRNSLTYKEDGSVNREPPPRFDCSHVHNVIVGSSQIAVDTIVRECLDSGIVPVILDSAATTEAERSAVMLANVAHFVCEIIAKSSRLEFNESLAKAEINCIKSGATKDQLRRIALAAEYAVASRQPCCIIFAGEQTTLTRGKGRGGPCLHLALKAAVVLRELYAVHKSFRSCDVQLLSADSDGLDGGTGAAGAIADCNQAAVSVGGKTADQHLSECNSLGFYLADSNKHHMVTTGLTGTDVMCFQLLFVGKRHN